MHELLDVFLARLWQGDVAEQQVALASDGEVIGVRAQKDGRGFDSFVLHAAGVCGCRGDVLVELHPKAANHSDFNEAIALRAWAEVVVTDTRPRLPERG